MTVDTVSRNKLKICLSGDETNTLFGGYDKINYEDPHTRLVLNTLLQEALPQKAFALDCDRLLIEVKPLENGCIIYLTKLYSNAARRFHRVSPSECHILIFPDSESLIRAVCELYRRPRTRQIKSDLYRTESSYRLVLFGEHGVGADLLHLREYCTDILHSPYGAAATAEYGSPICKQNAVKTLGGAFFKG